MKFRVIRSPTLIPVSMFLVWKVCLYIFVVWPFGIPLTAECWGIFFWG